MTTITLTVPVLDANPSASLGLSAVNGTATTYMRSDGAPALSQAIAPTWTGLHTFNLAGAASAPSVRLSGTWFSGGSSSTTWPNLLIQPASGANAPSYSTSGTGLAINAPSGFGGNLVAFYTNGGNAQFSVDSAGSISSGNNLSLINNSSKIFLGGSNQNIFINGGGTGILQLGSGNAASPVAQTVQAQGSRSGTDTDIGGANLTVRAGNGTGAGTISSLILQSPVAIASGSGAQTQTTGLTIKGGQAVTSTYTVSTLPTGITGGMAYITDGDGGLAWGATAVNSGAGATKYLVWYNGSAWTVVGK